MPVSSKQFQPPAQSQDIVVAFDFDGTISTSDSLRDFVRHAVGPGRFTLGLISASPWLLGMLLGLCDRASAKARFLAVTLAGTTQPALEEMARHYAETRLPLLVRPDMAARIREHRQRGHRLVLVSASPALYLKYWASSAGFDTVLATELEFRDGRFTGRLASPNCWGPQKVQRLQQWFGDNPPHSLYAYGDSRGDREMLALADHAWLRGSIVMPQIDAWPAH
ncbi:Phosphoserine phosphatase [Collimonas arenae]|uniref:Phosphoserine phosphatase n=1 Tax=Collimonas arenae TaxID=279058 RepID=A0A0A1FCB4_9BURK|nr:HAD family hydrolase [Collimonas arenae]AIY42156.1 Phosphoserine phosphatase [Collimonas arenae]